MAEAESARSEAERGREEAEALIRQITEEVGKTAEEQNANMQKLSADNEDLRAALQQAKIYFDESEVAAKASWGLICRLRDFLAYLGVHVANVMHDHDDALHNLSWVEEGFEAAKVGVTAFGDTAPRSVGLLPSEPSTYRRFFLTMKCAKT